MKWVLKILTTIGSILIVTLLVLYLKVCIYTFPEPQPFSGTEWYNPYHALSDTLLRANFHAHSYCWAGLTYGENSEEELSQAYQEEGYHIAGISNYHSISEYGSDGMLYLPMYEHGFNVHKVHCLAIGAERVSRTLFPVHFTKHQKQQEIAAVGRIAALTAIAHPTTGRYSLEEMEQLSGYELMEVGNSIGMSVAHWDAALSAGIRSWVIGDDDTHSLTAQPPFVKWTRIYVDTPTSASTILSLRSGRHYGVESYNHDCEDNRLVQFDVRNDTLEVTMRDRANRIDMIGQGGEVVHRVGPTSHIIYPLQPSDTYIRVEVHHDSCVMYLNPVIRYNGTLATPQVPQVSLINTWLARAFVAALIVLVIVGTRTLLDRIVRREKA